MSHRGLFYGWVVLAAAAMAASVSRAASTISRSLDSGRIGRVTILLPVAS